MSSNNRPLSPHLDIYKWRITMLTSILHRATGTIVCLGLFILVVKLTSLAFADPTDFKPTGMLFNAFWFIWTLAVYYHLCNGVRHLIWDAGKGFDVAFTEKTARISIGVAIGLTLLTWFIIGA